jgi:hypothetical protein
MSIIKLKNAGEEITLGIAAVEIVPATDPKMGAQVKFTDVNGDDLYVGESAVLRQLDRCGVSEIAELAGQNIHFSRAANTKNPGFPPFWNLDKARNGDTVKSSGSNGKSPAPPRTETPQVGRLPGDSDTAFDEIVNRYGECLQTAQTEIVPTLKKAGYEIGTSELLSIAATLYIARQRVGA